MTTALDSQMRIKLTVRRAALGLNQRELAKLMRTSQSHVCELETGKHDPGLTTLQTWATALGFGLEIRLTDAWDQS